MSRRIGRLALAAEAGFAALRGPHRGRPVILPYPGYATPDSLVLTGRVLAADSPALRAAPGVAHLFRTHELPGVRLRATVAGQSAVTETDEEGYFRLRLPRFPATGWQQVSVQGPACQAAAAVLVPDPGAPAMIISDIDDTVLATGAWNLFRNVWTTLTGTLDERHVFADAVALLSGRPGGALCPVYWVSSSPWNLYPFLAALFAKAGLPRGVFFLRDWGLAEGRMVAGPHGTHKGAAIDTLMAANPGLPAVLIGDTGQKDATIYAAAVARHPGRIAQVILRQAVRPVNRAALAAIAAAGVQVDVVQDFAVPGLKWAAPPRR